MIGPTKTEPTKAAPETLVRDNLALLEVTACSEALDYSLLPYMDSIPKIEREVWGCRGDCLLGGLGLLIITIYGQYSQNRTGSVALPR